MPTLAAGLTRSVFAAALLGACAESVAPKGPVDHLVVVSGADQEGFTLDTLPEHLVVRLVDDAGLPLAGRPVTWSSEPDASRIIPTARTTDASGTARAIAVLGFTPGEQRFVARVDGFDEAAVFEIAVESRPGFEAVSLMRGGTADHMCGIDREGRAWCWGPNESGQLGTGDFEASEVPRPVLTSLRFRRLVGLYQGTCGITHGSELWCWGNGIGGAFGNGRDEQSSVPIRAAGGLLLRDFDADFPLTCGITVDSLAYCWGRGILGDGNPPSTMLDPVRVAGDSRWIDISVGDSHVCAIDDAHSVWCWGRSFLTGLDEDAVTPTAIPRIPPLASLTSGWGLGTAAHCGLPVAGGGMMVCWGAEPVSQQRIDGLPVSGVELEAQTGMARTIDGRLWIWGQPPQCCDGFISAVPVALGPAGPWLDFTSGDDGAYAISAADSVVYRWTGFPGFGPPTGLLPRPVPVAAVP